MSELVWLLPISQPRQPKNAVPTWNARIPPEAPVDRKGTRLNPPGGTQPTHNPRLNSVYRCADNRGCLEIDADGTSSKKTAMSPGQFRGAAFPGTRSRLLSSTGSFRRTFHR